MDIRQPARRPRGRPPPAVMKAIRRRLSEREVQGLEALFALRATAQQVDNALNEWMAGTVGSVARFQILMALWAAKGKGIPHKDIVAAMGVTRATVSGLMTALEREGFVKSYEDRDDRRKLIARLTAKGNAVAKKVFEANLARFRAAFASLSSDELTNLTALMRRFRAGFDTPAIMSGSAPRADDP
jgi:DNA-binding MarR family transcriptional regulator